MFYIDTAFWWSWRHIGPIYSQASIICCICDLITHLYKNRNIKLYVCTSPVTYLHLSVLGKANIQYRLFSLRLWHQCKYKLTDTCGSDRGQTPQDVSAQPFRAALHISHIEQHVAFWSTVELSLWGFRNFLQERLTMLPRIRPRPLPASL